MKKQLLATSAGVLALAGLAWAAAGGNGAGGGNGLVQLAAAAGGAGGGAPTVQASPAAASGEFQLAADGRHIVDSYICVFRAGAVARGGERAEANRSANAAGGRVGHVYDVALQGFSINASARGVEMMQRNNRAIEYCEQDQVMAVITPVEAQAQPGGGVTIAAETLPPGIVRVNGGVTSGFSGRAFVIDTGIDLTHPDLNVEPQGNGNDGKSANFVSRETSANDLNGHGSHVAGTIGAIKDNGIGSVGVAAGARVVAVRVLNRRGSGSNADVIAGVNYVAKFGVAGDVANMSLGGGVSTALDNAVLAASGKVKFALAAGNETDDANNHSPARVNGPNIYTIAAFSPHTGAWASFSNYRTPPVDYAEPGVSIYSTWKSGGYNTISGTSMATPHMAGILLLGAVRTDGFVTRTGATDSYAIGVH